MKYYAFLNKVIVQVPHEFWEIQPIQMVDYMGYRIYLHKFHSDNMDHNPVYIYDKFLRTHFLSTAKDYEAAVEYINFREQWSNG